MKRLITIGCFGLILGGVYGADLDNVVMQLQFFTQTYRLNNEIPVLVSVVNTGDSRFEFDVSSEINETFFFEVKTPQSESIEINKDFGIEMEENYSSSEGYREIILDENESFSHQIDISEWFDFEEAGYYYLRGIFYPNPDDKSKNIESIYYKILVKAPLIVEESITDEEQERLEELEEAALYPPYRAIEDMIQAKMEKDWERFLLHIDTEKLIQDFQNYSDEYNNAITGSRQLEILEDFEDYLTEYWQDTVLSYEVTESTIWGDEAEVICEVEYKIRQSSYTMQYTFSMYQNHDEQWLVDSYYAHIID